MAGSVATLAVLWISLQSLGFLGTSHSIGSYKLQNALQDHLPIYLSIPTYDYRQDLIVLGNFEHKTWPIIKENALNASVSYGHMLVKLLGRLESNIANAGIGLPIDSPSHSQYIYSYPIDDALEKAYDAIIAVKASSYLVQHHCRRFGMDFNACARFISTIKLEGTSLNAACAAEQQADCNLNYKYRSIDGTCNNLENPKLGSVMTAYTRLLFPEYMDGIQEPRHERRGANALPNPRLVSTTLSSASNQSEVSKTLVVMQWSEFISHDIAHTPVRKMPTGSPISCCQEDGNWLAPRYIHPDCAAISVPDYDPIYGKQSIHCMNYVRSLPVLRADCSFGPLEQMNQVSHFLDGSTIYGSTMKRSRELRTFEGGKLRTEIRNNREFLPTADSEPASLCRSSKCYLSGDDRVNAEPYLTVMHTVWHREHNRIAKELAVLNPLWTDEILYQEARRIVVAEIQHITYNEWLPMLFGKTYIQTLGLLSGTDHNQDYNSDEDPGVSNEAATAALQFLKSLKQSKLSLPEESRAVNKTLRLREYFYKPNIIESDDVFDGIIRGLSTQTSQKMDTNLVSDLTHELFKTKGVVGLDALSLDIQRGRDHGFAGYNHYRKYCGLSVAKKFDDFLDYIPNETVKKLRKLYKNPDDVDLVIGGIAERSADDGILGPTFRCLISEQFGRTRRTDRFFYDSDKQVYPFTPDQLAAIQNVTLARVFCDNSDDILHMQRNVFLKPQFGNELRSCDDFEAIPSVDLFAWAEKAKAYR